MENIHSVHSDLSKPHQDTLGSYQVPGMEGAGYDPHFEVCLNQWLEI